MLHIIERFAIHFASSTFLTVCIYYALRYWLNHNSKVSGWLSSRKFHLLVTSALIVFALFTLREPWDVYAANNTIVKSYFDILSWFLGPAVSVWGLHRLEKIQ